MFIHKKQLKFQTLKILIFLVLSVFLLFNASQTKTTYGVAFVPTYDGIDHATADIPKLIETITHVAKEIIGDVAAYAVSQELQNILIQEVVNRIKNLDGDTAFITNLESHLQSYETLTTEDFASEFIDINTCDFSPTFNTDLSNSIRLNTRENYTEKFRVSLDCSAFEDSIPSGNTQDFARDIRNGGWEAWQEGFSNPANDPYGVIMLAQAEQQQRVVDAQNRAEQEAAWGSGFRSLKDADTGIVLTPGSTIKNQLDDAIGSVWDRITNADELSEIVVSALSAHVRDTLSGL